MSFGIKSCRNAKVRAKIGMQGWIKNTNTIEEFKSLDKQKLLQDLSEEVLNIEAQDIS
jgi:hypothetical protein